MTRHALCISAGLIFAIVGSKAAGAETHVKYERDVQPILSNSCYTCHGPDDKHREAKLRLDVREVAVKKAIRPGHSSDSPLIQRVTSTDPDEHMPPADSGRAALTAAQVDVLRRWIDEGAKFDRHWSYVPVVRPQVPPPADPHWVRNPIDNFILRRLEREGLKPSAEADQRTLVRRLSFDLVGLPPTPEEVDAFVADTSPKAYEKLVDRLLASPHFGERMAIYWLDLVRYADTEGYHGDQERPHWLYRDYVIRSFNENKPFDQFTIEQLAGDLLPKPTYWQKIASGYNRLNLTTAEGGAQPKEFIAKYGADRVRDASAVWLGSTLGCAQCHNHKFDPFLTRDFYRFQAFFADVDETIVGHQTPTMMLSEALQKQVDDLGVQIASLKRQLEAPSVELASAQAAWEKAESPQLPQWHTALPISATAKNGSKLKILDDGSVMAVGEGPETDTYTIVVKTRLTGINALRLEALTDPSFPDSGPGRSDFGNFILSELAVKAPVKKVEEKLSDPMADVAQGGFPVAAAIDGNRKTGWGIHPYTDANHAAEFRVRPALGKPGEETKFTVVLTHEFGQHTTLGKFRIDVASTPPCAKCSQEAMIPKGIADLLRIDSARRTSAQRGEIKAYYRGIAPALAPVREKLRSLQTQREEIQKKGDPILITVSVAPRQVRVLPRGDWLLDTGEIVEPGVPTFMTQLAVGKRRATRLDLARWLVDPANPLVARVYVNRLWKLMFGRGIVSTLEDFGSQGAPPTHPELLDYLAAEFVSSGWSTKSVLKLMVMSATYRQSSLANEEMRRRDPVNQFLARQGRFRLDAELIRDNALAVSGLLVAKIGGPSVKPYQPKGYYAHLNFPKREYQEARGEDLYRRGVYTHWQRTYLHPSLLAFDAPSREFCTVERPRSNTPLAALVLLNDPTYVEAARALAAKALREGGGTAPGRLRYIFRQVLDRPPAAAESEILLQLCDKHRAEYRSNMAAASQLLSVGESPVPSDLPKDELAAWTSVSRAVLNLHETITRN